MNVRTAAFLLLTSLCADPGRGQGFSGLGSDAAGYALPDPDRVLVFPADHGPHPAFRIEWWYLTATLSGGDGRDYGIQWTLFRSALESKTRPGWQSPQLWMGHAAVTAPDLHLYAERLARGGIGQAGATAVPFRAWIDDWSMTGSEDGDLSPLSLRARGADFSYELDLTAETPLVLHGDAGFSVKSEDGQASHYYSQPGYAVSGSLQLPTGPVEVTGQAWLDREWSSQPLSDDQSGWDWFSLSFETGEKFMGYRLRGPGSTYDVATWIDAQGIATPLPEGAFVADALGSAIVAGRRVPVHWRIRLPETGLDVELEALNAQSWMGTSIPYWEGPVRVTGSHTGRGYLEMTGYD